MVNKKKLTAGVAALILCITGVTYGTLAYFTDKDTRANVITIGHVTGTLTETDMITDFIINQMIIKNNNIR